MLLLIIRIYFTMISYLLLLLIDNFRRQLYLNIRISYYYITTTINNNNNLNAKKTSFPARSWAVM